MFEANIILDLTEGLSIADTGEFVRGAADVAPGVDQVRPDVASASRTTSVGSTRWAVPASA